MVHWDVKPANILCESSAPFLTDFGIVRLVDGTRLTAQDHRHRGHLARASAVKTSTSSDIYSWDWFCWSLTGKPEHPGSSRRGRGSQAHSATAHSIHPATRLVAALTAMTSGDKISGPQHQMWRKHFGNSRHHQLTPRQPS